MKNLKRFSIIFVCILLALTSFVGIKSLRKGDSGSVKEFYVFENSVTGLLSDDKMQGVKLSSENATLENMVNSLGLTPIDSDEGISIKNNTTGENYQTFKPSLNTSVDSEMFRDICNELGYVAFETSDGYEIFSKYVLKRLIVFGDIDESYGATNVVSGYKNYNILSYDNEFDTKNAYKKLIADGQEVYVDSVIVAQAEVEGSYDYSNDRTWGAEAIEIGAYRDYLDVNGTNRDVVVAVVDSGINTSHSMFSGRIVTDGNSNYVGTSYYTTNYTYSGYSFEDDDGHGTHVSGIICDLTPNNVKILPIKVFDSTGHGSTLAIFSALEKIYEVYAPSYNIACINMSLGCGYYSYGYTEFKSIFSDLRTNKNILPIVAAGNESDNTSNYLPAACENAVVVSSLKQSGTSVLFDDSYSNFGSHVDISAPGTRISSAYIGASNGVYANTYATLSGTSMATPHVSGVVALLCSDASYYQTTLPTYTASNIESLLYENALDLGSSGFDIFYGHGMASLSNYTVEKVDSKLSFYDNGNLIDLGLSYYSFEDSMVLEIECEDPSLSICYTTDGSIPSYQTSQKYTGSIGILESTTVKAVGYLLTDGVLTKITEVFEVTLFSANQPIEDYFEIDEYGEITSYKGHFTDLVIPDTIDGIEVKSLTPSLFKGSELVSIELPNSCTTLGGYVFQDCLMLEKVIAPGVEKIYISAFRHCPNIEIVSSSALDDGEKGIYLPKLQEALSYAFSANTALKSVRLDGLTTIGDALFYGCSALTICQIMNITTISSACFYQCSSLQGFTIGEKVESVGELAFYGVADSIDLKVHSANTSFYADGTALYSSNSLVYLYNRDGGNYSVLSSIKLNGTLSNIVTIEPCSMMNLNLAELVIPLTVSSIGGNAVYESSIGTLDYRAKSVSSSSYIVQYEDGSFGIALPFGGTYIQNLMISTSSKKVPERLFQGAYVNNLHIESTNTTYESGAFYCYDLDNVYYDFSTSATSTYVSKFLNTYAFIYSPDLFVKTAFDGFTISSYSNYGLTNNYYVYSTKNRTGVEFIEYNAMDSVHVYDGEAHNIYVDVDDSVTNYSISYGLSVGVYDITDVSGIENFVDISSETPVYFKISADGYYDAYGSALLTIKEDNSDATDIVITIENQSSIYGNQVSVDDSLYSVNINVDMSNVAIGISTDASNESDVGSYPLVGTVLNSGGYNITFVNADYVIIQRNITILVESQTGVYGDDVEIKQLYSISKGNLVNGDALNITLQTAANETSDVGSYDIDVVSVGNDNYDIDVVGGYYTIFARPITFDIEDQTAIYGDVNIDGDKFSVYSGEIVNGDNLNIELYTVATNFSGVGIYYIYLNHDNQNYDVSYYAGALEIQKREVTIKLDNQRMVYGGTYSRVQNEYAVVKGEIVNDDDLNITLHSSIGQRSNVGDYELFAVYSNANYDVSFITSVLTIDPRNISIKLDNQSSIYGGAIILSSTDYVITSGMLLDGDDLKLTLSTTAQEFSGVGEYEITATSDNKNYNCTITNGVYVVNKRELVIKILNQTLEYSENMVIDQTAYVITSGILYDIDDLKIKIKTPANVVELMPDTIYILEGEWDNKNYSVNFIDGELVIEEAQTSLFSSIPTYVIYGVIGIVLISGLLIFARRKKPKEEDFS